MMSKRLKRQQVYVYGYLLPHRLPFGLIVHLFFLFFVCEKGVDVGVQEKKKKEGAAAQPLFRSGRKWHCRKSVRIDSR